MIHFTTYYDNRIQKLGDFLKAQLKKYCLDHNLSLTYGNNPLVDVNAYPTWQKIFRLSHVMSSCRTGDWIIYIDADNALLDNNKNLTFLNNTNKNILFSKDWNGICCAGIAIRCCEWSESFLSCVRLLGDLDSKYDDDFGLGCGPKYEQNVIKTLQKYFPSIRDNIGYLPDWFMTDNPDFNNPPMFWHYGSANSVDKKHWILDNVVHGKIVSSMG